MLPYTGGRNQDKEFTAVLDVKNGNEIWKIFGN